MKTNELTGKNLAIWVARANGWKVGQDGGEPGPEYLICWDAQGNPSCFGQYGYQPDMKWEQGGPLLERERIGLVPRPGGVWHAGYSHQRIGEGGIGPTALIAAMRAYVASVYGCTVPDENPS